MTVQPLVSVVVPTLNATRHLRQTLNSVMAQTLPGVELIVVDDGSCDDTVELVRREFSGVQLLEQPNAGVSSARNRGLALARGRYVCFLDQDDVWFPEMLARQVELLEGRPEVGAVACPYAHWYPETDAGKRMLTVPPDPGLTLVSGFESWTYHEFLLDCWALTSATMLRAEVARQVGGFDPGRLYAEDWDLWLRVSRQYCFVQLSWPPVLYRQHEVQGSRTIRQVDYRSELLMGVARAHGLASPDGQAVTAARFRARIARHRMEFGYHHLQYGDRRTGVKSLLIAWATQPAQWRWLALAALGALGWRPGALGAGA